MKMLKSKLLEIKEREKLEKIDDIKGVKQILNGDLKYVRMCLCLILSQKNNRTDMRTEIYRQLWTARSTDL